MLIDTNGHVTNDIFVNARLALELCNDGTRAFDVEHHEVCLAVTVDLVGEVLETPGLGLGNLAIVCFDDFGRRGGELVDLSLAQILSRQENMLVESHALVLSTGGRSLADPRDCGAPPAFFLSPDRFFRQREMRAHSVFCRLCKQEEVLVRAERAGQGVVGLPN